MIKVTLIYSDEEDKAIWGTETLKMKKVIIEPPYLILKNKDGLTQIPIADIESASIEELKTRRKAVHK